MNGRGIIPKPGFFSLVRMFLLFLVLVGFAAPGHGQDLAVSPWPSFDFGDVEVGASRTQTVTLSSLGPTAVWTYVVALSNTPSFDSFITPWSWDPVSGGRVLGSYSLGAFSFDPYGDIWFQLPKEMPTGDSLNADVIFTPGEPGEFIGYLGIESNDSIPPPGPQAFLRLTGTGAPMAVPEPSTMLLVASGVVGLVCAGRKSRK